MDFTFDQKEFYFLASLIKDANDLFIHISPSQSYLNNINFSRFSKLDHISKKDFLEKDLSTLKSKILETTLNLATLDFKSFGSFKYKLLSIVSSKAKENIAFHRKYLELLQEIEKVKELSFELKAQNLNEEISNHLGLLISLIDGIIDEKHSIPYFEKWVELSSRLEIKYVKLLSKFSKSEGDLNNVFKKWFFENLLNRSDIDFTERPIQSLENDLFSNKNHVRLRALDFWERKRYKTIQAFNEKDGSLTAKQLYSKTSSKKLKKKTLRQIIRTDYKLFSDIFPVILINPSVCSSLFELRPNLFNVVIFDEASQLRIEDTFASLLRGQIKIISGDEKQMPPSSYFNSGDIFLNDDETAEEEITEDQLGQEYAMKESLLEFASDSKFRDIHLNMHYRSKHPSLIDFSNAAFYKNRLIPMPSKNNYLPIEYINISGVYAERKNLDEALKIISIIENRILAINGEYPSVGIATFNMEQRNLILELINKKCIEDKDFREKIRELENKEFFVKNSENIQGDERDIIIISTTFGKNNLGVFFKKFGPVIQAKGPKLLNVIVTRAKIKQIVVTSFPEEEFLNYNSILKEKGINGLAVLFSYLAYSKSISEGDINQTNEILKNLASADDSEAAIADISKKTHLMPELIRDKLVLNGIPKENISVNYSYGGFICDLYIDYLEVKLAIDVDAPNLYKVKNNYHSYIFKKKQLSNYDINYFILWSIKFWQNEEFEIRKILGIVLNDSEVK